MRVRAQKPPGISAPPKSNARVGWLKPTRSSPKALAWAEGCLRYLWINTLGENGQDVIYVPTEAGTPILEAGKRPAPLQVSPTR
jgi:hypothetical protein